MKGEPVDLHAVTESGRSSGVEHGDVLVAFAEAAVGGDASAIAFTRQRVIDAMGVEAMVDAAAVVSNFERMVRIADGTGIPLGTRLEAIGRPVVEELQLDRLRANDGVT